MIGYIQGNKYKSKGDKLGKYIIYYFKSLSLFIYVVFLIYDLHNIVSAIKSRRLRQNGYRLVCRSADERNTVLKLSLKKLVVVMLVRFS